MLPGQRMAGAGEIGGHAFELDLATIVAGAGTQVGLEGGDREETSPGRVWMIATMEPGMIGLMEPLETPRIRASESKSFSRFHDAPQALFGLF
jgi:hypothetical protein